jgi:16S rRNA (guanine527-N7)-methyltransferase
VFPERAETIAFTQRPEIVTARAVAPIGRLLDLFAKVIKTGTKLLLYKGPDVERELAEAEKYGVRAEVVCRYELPYMLGARTLIQIQAGGRR